MKYLFIGIGETFPSLTKFAARRSKVKFISRRNFKYMRGLKILDFVGNEIATIPATAFLDLVGLTILDLKGNRIKALPNDLLVNQKVLSQLILSQNRLESFNQTLIRNNNRLRFFNFDKNNLTEISVNFTLFKNIRVLEASGNPCTNNSILKFRYDSSNDSLEELEEVISAVKSECSGMTQATILMNSTVLDEEAMEITTEGLELTGGNQPET